MTVEAKNELAHICRIIIETIEVEEIHLFGSYAYGTPNPDSDYDLCVVIPDGALRPTEAVKAIRRALFSVQTTSLDVLVYHASAFRERQKEASLERQIAREGVLLYERKELEQQGLGSNMQ